MSFRRSVDEAELTQALMASVTCAILAEAGPQRSRTLATLYKDERCSALPVLFSILEKVRGAHLLPFGARLVGSFRAILDGVEWNPSNSG